MAWCKLIWFSNAIPRCAFISWLAIRDRLSIKERLATRGIGNESLCVMCSNAVENRDSLSVPLLKEFGEGSNTGATKIILGMIGLTLLIGRRRIGA